MQSAIDFPVWHLVVGNAIFSAVPTKWGGWVQAVDKQTNIKGSILESTSISVDLYRHVQDKKGSYGDKKV